MKLLKKIFNLAEKEEDAQEKKDQKNFSILKYDGLKAIRMGQAAYGIRCFNEALKYNDDEEIYFWLAQTYSGLHQEKDALKSIAQLLELNAAHLGGLLLQGHLFFQQMEYDVAMESIQKAKSLAGEEELVELLFLEGLVLQRQEKHELAIASFSELIERKEDFGAAYRLRAKSERLLNMFEEALNDAQEAFNKNPEDERAKLEEAQIMLAKNREEDAITLFKETLEIDPFNIEAHQCLSSMLIQKGMMDQLLGYLNEWIDNQPHQGYLYRLRGEVYEKMGRQEDAAEDFETAEELVENEEGEKTDDFSQLYSGGLF